MRYLTIYSSLLFMAGLGCQMSPVPQKISHWHERAQREVPAIESLVQPGDIVFRLSNTQLAGGLVDFSKTIAKTTESYLSHAALVYHVGPDGAMIVDVTPNGVERRYLVDWYVQGTKNFCVKRLKPEYRFLIPQVLAELDKLIARDVLYDDKFVPDDDRFYCTELVDHCFRVLGYPLAPRIRIKDFPKYNLVMHTGILIGGIDNRNLAVIAGNERIGLFSSPMLETVIDFRGRSPEEIERLLPPTHLVKRSFRGGAAGSSVWPPTNRHGYPRPAYAPSFEEEVPEQSADASSNGKTAG